MAIATLEKTADKTISEYNMLKPGDSVLIGLSGGADSVALFHYLCGLREKMGLTLIAGHINHMLRGEDSFNDEEFCRELCARCNVEFMFFRANCKLWAENTRVSIETAGRNMRRLFLGEWARNHNARVALAHNQNDNAETMFMRLCRGTGTTGLSGIAPVSENIVRPLIFVPRERIIEYLTRQGLTYRDDDTNADTVYTRNYIRHEIIPRLTERLNPNLLNGLTDMARMFGEENDYLEQLASEAFRSSVKTGVGYASVNVTTIAPFHPVIKRRVIRMAISQIWGHNNDYGMTHIEAVMSLFDKQSGKYVTLPYNLIAERLQSAVVLRRREQAFAPFSQEIRLDTPIHLAETDETIIISRRKNIANYVCTNYFSNDKIRNGLYLRNRRDGDTVKIVGVGRRKLKDVFIDKKIPRHERDAIPLVTDGDSVVCVRGILTSAEYHIGVDTADVLYVHTNKISRGDNIMKEQVTELIATEVVRARVEELAAQISKDFEGETLMLICVLKGGVMFMTELAKNLKLQTEFGFLDISSYGASTISSGNPVLGRDLDMDLTGKNVLLVEDIIDTGRTLAKLVEHINTKNPKQLKLITLLDKPARRVVFNLHPDYIGFSIPDEFVVGYGLDYDQRYRNLPYIGTLRFIEE